MNPSLPNGKYPFKLTNFHMSQEISTSNVETTHIPELDLLVIKVTGKYTISENTDDIKRIISEIKDKKCTGFLFDFREADLIIKTLSVIKRTEVYEAASLPRSTKIGGIFRKIDKDAYFIESAFLNRSWRAKAFVTYEEALEWFKKPN